MLEMGRQAMRLAIAEPDAAEEIVRLPTELVVRESCVAAAPEM
jgi:DNA-binding LacI/PurR family transcriptional regulator